MVSKPDDYTQCGENAAAARQGKRDKYSHEMK
jgi:hypothetical protein